MDNSVSKSGVTEMEDEKEKILRWLIGVDYLLKWWFFSAAQIEERLDMLDFIMESGDNSVEVEQERSALQGLLYRRYQKSNRKRP